MVPDYYGDYDDDGGNQQQQQQEEALFVFSKTNRYSQCYRAA